METITQQSEKVRVLMLSLDPGLARSSSSAGNTLDRHRRYAADVRSLDIVVCGGRRNERMSYDHGKLHVYTTGTPGIRNLWVAHSLAGRIIREHGINLIVTQDPHATGIIGLRLKRKYHIPLLVHLHGDFVNNPYWKKESWKNQIYDRIQRRVLAGADGIRATTAGIKDSLISYGIQPELIRVLHTPVDDSVFLQDNEKIKVSVEKLRYKYRDKKVLVFCGRFVAAKNIFFMLRVVQQLKRRRNDFVLLLIGEGEELDVITKEMRRADIEDVVHIIGPLQHESLVVFYRLALLLVLFSTNESFGKVIVEAGLAGTPCLASDTVGARSVIVEGATGFIVPINHLDATVDVLDEMLEYPHFTQQLGVWARQTYSERYAFERSKRAITQFWREIVRRSRT